MRVPPGGFAAFGQESPATQALWGRFIRGSNGTGSRRRKSKANGTVRKRRKKRASARRAKPRKGSAAMKRKMARLRAMRRK